MWKDIVEPDRLQITIWRMRIACWIPKSANIHSEYVILIVFSLQQLLTLNSTLCVQYIACLDFVFPCLLGGFLFYFFYLPHLFNGCRCSSPGWSVQGVRLISHLHLVPSLGISGDIFSLALYAFMACTGKAIPLRFTSTLLSPFLFYFLCLCKCVNADWSIPLSLRAACVSFITATNFIKTLPLPPTHDMFAPFLLYVSKARHLDFPQLFRRVCWGCTVLLEAILSAIGS